MPCVESRACKLVLKRHECGSFLPFQTIPTLATTVSAHLVATDFRRQADGAGLFDPRQLEQPEVESKLVRLKEMLTERGVFQDPKIKLGALRDWTLPVTQIHGGMKIGDRDTEGSCIYAR